MLSSSARDVSSNAVHIKSPGARRIVGDMVYFYGCANPKPREDGYSGFELNREDVENAVRELVGKPILIEHEGKEVGHVDSAWQIADGRLMVIGHTNDDTVWSRFGGNLVTDGQLRELSIGSRVRLNARTLTVVGKNYDEVSLVEEGLRDGTRIERVEAAPTADGRYKLPRRNRGAGPTTQATTVKVRASMATAEAAETEKAAVETPAAAPVDESTLLARLAELEKSNTQIQQRNKFLEDKHGRQYKAAYEGAIQKFLAELETEDPEQLKIFTAGLQKMVDEPHMATSGGDAVMQVMCAASRLNKKKEEALQEALNKIKSNANQETATKKRKAETTLSSTTSRVQSAHAAGRGMAERDPDMFSWLSEGGDKVGMDRVDYINRA